MTQHKHYTAAYRAHTGTSFSPEKRAESECRYFDEIMSEFEKLGVNEEGKAKFERLFINMLSAKSRCLSTMIAGPANFPVRRAEKANARERAVSDELLTYVERVKKAIDKQNNPQNYPISSDDESAIERLKEKLENLTAAQEKMKACNKIVKDKKGEKIERLTELLGDKDFAEKVMDPDFCGRVGFASYQLTNNNATIKATADRILQLEAAAERKSSEVVIAGVRVLQNAEENRIQFFFEGRPASEVTSLMKKHGFKWSPRNVCWQRLWNNNAVFSVKNYIKPALEIINNKNEV